MACTLAGGLEVLKQPRETWPELPYEQMDRCSTYLFEICHPDVINVVRQREPRLWHLSTRSVFPDEAAAASGSLSAYDEAFLFPESKPEDKPVLGIPLVRTLLILFL